MLPPIGSSTLFRAYRKLLEELGIDVIVLVDGGVDSLLRGDEALPETILEDVVTLAAVSELTEVPVRLIACLGFGTEREVSGVPRAGPGEHRGAETTQEALFTIHQVRQRLQTRPGTRIPLP